MCVHILSASSVKLIEIVKLISDIFLHFHVRRKLSGPLSYLSLAMGPWLNADWGPLYYNNRL